MLRLSLIALLLVTAACTNRNVRIATAAPVPFVEDVTSDDFTPPDTN
jgi:hypothetical protein